MKSCVLDSSHDSRAKVFAALARDLHCPAGSGRNLDALWDVLRTDIKGPIAITWKDSAAARRALGGDYEPIAKLLRDLAAARADVTVRFD